MTGDLKGIGSKYEDRESAPERLGRGIHGGLRAAAAAGGGGAGNPATVTLADGSKLEGTLVRKDDFLVVLTLPDGTRKSIARNNGDAEGRRQGSAGSAQEDGARSSTIRTTRRCTTLPRICGRSSRGSEDQK